MGVDGNVPQGKNTVNLRQIPYNSAILETGALTMSGILYLVATPIGNLSDISARALETLSSVALIACEDTRVTRKLLQHYQIRTRTQSYHEHNEDSQTPKLIRILESGKNIALVTDAGSPSISDPGLRLVRNAHAADIAVRAIPGPSAAVSALILSGLPAHRFTFVGFVPSRGAARQRAIESLADEHHTVVLFEASQRVPRLLRTLAAQMGPREAFVAREMTKRFEEHRSGDLSSLARWVESQSATLKGEFTIVVGPPSARPSTDAAPADSELRARFQTLTAQGSSRREAVKQLAKEFGLKTRTVYQQVLPEAENTGEQGA